MTLFDHHTLVDIQDTQMMVVVVDIGPHILAAVVQSHNYYSYSVE